MAEDPFHDGEREAQARAGLASRGGGIRHFMPDQHRSFFAGLPWIFAAMVDDGGWPLATVLTGEAGFIDSPTATTLSIRTPPAGDDPGDDALRPGAPIGLLGIEFETRRRNRANGFVVARDAGVFSVSVMQSFGNCAKYIQIRHPHGTRPYEPLAVETLPGLDDEARAMISQADTVFVASATGAGHPGGGLDMSHRGGRPGFIRIDGGVLTLPDFAGNNYFNTLGNLLLEPRAALLVVDFATGTVLQLQGIAEVVWSGAELARLSGTQRLWRFRVARGWRRRHALPWLWSEPEFAPTTLETGTWTKAAA